MATLPSGFGVLVTRPAEQADNLCRLVEEAGGRAIRLPLLAIVPVDSESEGPQTLRSLGQPDWLIFVSANAVRCAFELLGPQWLKSRPAKIAAIGLATAQALAERGVTVDLKPKRQFNSEALLAMPEWEDVTGQQFVIVRGIGGRELLAETLRQRGGRVAYAEIYRRIDTEIDMAGLLARWRAGEIGTVTVTSGEALEHLSRLMAGEDRELMLTTPMVIIGERLGEQARKLGCRRVVTADANDANIFDAVAGIARELNQFTNFRG